MKKLTLPVFIIVLSVVVLAQENSNEPGKRPMEKEIYRTFEEFMTGESSCEDDFWIENAQREQKKWKGTISKTPRYTKNNNKIKSIWGFCDGQDYYVKSPHFYEFFKLEVFSKPYSYFG
jgi:hypothetical protein